MHMAEYTVGFVPLARPTFDISLAMAVAETARAQLAAAGLGIRGPDELVTSLAAAEQVGDRLAERPLDLLVVFQATFADSTMVKCLAGRVDAQHVGPPLLLWAVPEERTGGRLRLNSLCGINLAGHALRRAGYRYEYMYAPPDDAAAVERVGTLARAGRVRRRLRGARIGRIGENPDGFESCLPNASGLKRHFGLEVVPVELAQVFADARAAPRQEVDAVAGALADRLDGWEALDQAAVRGTLAAYVALRRMAGQAGLHGLAVRCWPEFFTDLGCAACGAMSMLSDELTPCSCEADVNGTVTQLILQWLSGGPAFGTDMVSFEVAEDVAVLWHWGPASARRPAVTGG